MNNKANGARPMSDKPWIAIEGDSFSITETDGATCETRGHLWGPLSKCVMCGASATPAETSAVETIHNLLKKSMDDAIEIARLRAVLTEIARLGVDMHHDFSRSAMQSKIAREALS